MKFYRIGNQLFDFETLESSRVEVDGSNIVIGWRECKLATAAEAQKAFDRIAAILGAEDLCGDEEAPAAPKILYSFGNGRVVEVKCNDSNYPYMSTHPAFFHTREEAQRVAEVMARKGVWQPDLKEEYWTFSDSGFVGWDRWHLSSKNISDLDNGRVFRTREEAYSAAKLKERTTAEERWKPEYGEPYWTIVDGDVIECTWDGDQGDDLDREQFNAGLVFRTEEEAETSLAKMNEQPPEPTPEGPPELTVDDLAPRKAQEFAGKYWFAVGLIEEDVSWDSDRVDNRRALLGLAAQSPAEARAIADALAVIQEIKERSTADDNAHTRHAVRASDVPFGRFRTEQEANAVWVHIGAARLHNAAHWVKGLPLLIENYGE
jgi:hypothetical protein